MLRPPICTVGGAAANPSCGTPPRDARGSEASAREVVPFLWIPTLDAFIDSRLIALVLQLPIILTRTVVHDIGTQRMI